MTDFEMEIAERIKNVPKNQKLKSAASNFMLESMRAKYSYNYKWLGRPIIQYPQDMVAMQEIIWQVRPDLIIETGIAHGGSLIFNASLLANLDMCEAIEQNRNFNPSESARRVLGIDLDIRAHNLAAINSHPMSTRIKMIEGSSTDPSTIAEVLAFSTSFSKIMVCLDSNHTHSHVLDELNAYASLTSVGSYCVIFDTVIEELPKDVFPDRPWGPGDNPKKAVHEFLRTTKSFEIDNTVHDKLGITVARDGYLKRIQ